MIDRAVINPVLKSTADVKKGDFLTDADGKVYLVANEIYGDEAYMEDVTIKAGEFINGYLVEALKGQTLLVDAKHIAFGVGETYASSITAGTTLLGADSTTRKLKILNAAPASGVYFKVVNKCRLTEKAVEVEVIVADKDTVSSPSV